MRNTEIIGLLLLVILASGCADTESSTQAITVEKLSIEPDTLPAGASSTVTLEVRNSGTLEGNVRIGQDGNRTLTDHCRDLFSIQEFSASSTRTPSTETEYKLDSGERLEMIWRLNQDDVDEVPLPGYDCNLRFQVPFDYSASAFKQFQVKNSSDSQETAELTEKMTRGPMGIDMEIIGSTGESKNTLLSEDSNTASLYITAYHRGKEEESDYQGLIDIGDLDVNINASDRSGKDKVSFNTSDTCGDLGTVSLASGNERIYECPIIIDSFQGDAIRGEISADINYSYVRDLGSKTLKVEYNG